MAVRRRTVVWDGPGGPFEGVAAWDDGRQGPRPGVLIVPNVLGQKEADNLVAERLAALGYVALAGDVFGQGKRTTRESPDPAKYMNEAGADRGVLRDRLAAALDALKKLPEAEGARLAAFGYCFGGKCVLDMARAGLDVAAAVSFHGVYDRPDYATASPVRAKVLVCHGWDDPLGPPDAVTELCEELTRAGADWQLHAYGGAGHAFTDEGATAPGRPGFGFHADANRRSWAAATALLAEAFG